MKILIAAMMTLALLAGCNKDPESATQVNKEFAVDKLFTHEGCTVYRFIDDGRKYYTNCSGSVSFTRSCGKGCVYDERITGGKHD